MPDETASDEVKQAYVDAHKAKHVADEHIELADGTVVTHPEDLAPMVLPSSPTALSIDRYLIAKRNFVAAGIGSASFGVVIAGLIVGVVFGPAMLFAGTSLQTQWLALVGTYCGVYGSGLCAFLTCAGLAGTAIQYAQMVNARSEAFEELNPSLRRLLRTNTPEVPPDVVAPVDGADVDDDDAFDEGTDGTSF